MFISKDNPNLCYTHAIEDGRGHILADVFKGRDGLWRAVIPVPNWHNKTVLSAKTQAGLLQAAESAFARWGMAV